MVHAPFIFIINVMQSLILNYLEGQKEEILYLQRELVSRPALGPENQGQGEKEKSDFLKDYLQQIGFKQISELPAQDQRIESGYRPNLAAVLPGRDRDRTLWIVSHTDVVPAGSRELWESDPFSLVQKGDLIYGRGVEDNHHGLVASLLTAKAFLANNLSTKVNLGLLFVADEETGNKYGLDFVLNKHGHLFGDLDQFLVPDFGLANSEMVEVAEKSLLWIRFCVHGKQCHASTPGKGVNSLLACSALILNLRSLYDIFPKTDALFEPDFSTFESTKKEANVPNINTIPGRDIFYLDCRVLPDYDVQEVFRGIEKSVEDISSAYGVRIEFEAVHQEQASSTDPEEPIVKELIDAINSIYNVKAGPRGIGGGTVASYLRKKGYPAIVWSTLLGTAHQPNEMTSIDNIINDAKVMSVLLAE